MFRLKVFCTFGQIKPPYPMQTLINTAYSYPSLCFYALIYFLSNYRQIIYSFKGESQLALLALNIYTLAGTIAGTCFLVLMGYKHHWYTSFCIIVLGFMFNQSFGRFLSSKLSQLTIIFSGFVIIPIVAVLMFLLL
jgi:hypothetical protein